MRIGVIGTGNIGGMLAKAFAACPDTQVYVYNRTVSKAHALAETSQQVFVSPSPRAVAEGSDVVFVCTKPCDGNAVLEEVGPLLSQSQFLVATISTVPFEKLESYTEAGVAKVIPSIAQSARSGILLVSHGPSLTTAQRHTLEGLFKEIATPFVVEEQQIRVASDLASCGPAFIACLLDMWADAAVRTEKLNYVQAEHLLSATLIGVAQLLQSGMTLKDIITKVSVPGGVTEIGLQSLRQTAPQMFDDLHQTTARHAHQNPVGNLFRR
jgi:competence protein ComER